ncbi:MAG: class I SAM-dependent methyltransferase, partial [Chloroflexi bacterium]|nr:class I SAM-dependent methyltransferase [Chloroflexota bacterium]
FSRRAADLGCQVVACDVAPKMIEIARGRSRDYGERIEYLICDATDEIALLGLGEKCFDAAICSMALMDMPEISPLLSTVRRLLKPGGRFVFSVVHPCFNFNAVVRISETRNRR